MGVETSSDDLSAMRFTCTTMNFIDRIIGYYSFTNLDKAAAIDLNKSFYGRSLVFDTSFSSCLWSLLTLQISYHFEEYELLTFKRFARLVKK